MKPTRMYDLFMTFQAKVNLLPSSSYRFVFESNKKPLNRELVIIVCSWAFGS